MTIPKPALVLLIVLAACSGSVSPTTRPVESSPASISPATTAAASTTTTVVVTTRVATSDVTITAATTEPLSPLQGLHMELVAEGLRRPLLVAAPRNDARRFIVLQGGQVVVLREDGLIDDQPFLDISDEVNDNGIEQGLLGWAFHPDFDTNGRVFAYYSISTDDTRLSEFSAPPDGPVDPSTERILLEIAQPTVRHNAGMLEFGPDGYLYVGVGEGGAASENAQNPDTLLGSILRIDVDDGSPYGIPADNPFVAGDAPEVWAIGLRNPWRFAIDPAIGTMYVADVGHSDWEEINVVELAPVGHDFGWLSMEGAHCFQSGCDPEGLVLPVVEYSHAEGCSVTGGFVYRGVAIPELDGHYFYSDWCTGFLRSFRYVDGEVVDATDWTEELGSPGQVTSFGLDADGELHVTTWGGDVYKLVPVRE